MNTEKSFFVLRALGLSAALCLSTGFPAPARADDTIPPPKSWIDPDTGHRVIRLTDEPGSGAFYFNVNGYTPDGKEMVYTTPAGISVLNLSTLARRQLVKRPARTVVVAHKTPTLFYIVPGSDALSALWSINVDTGDTHKIADLPPRGSIVTINADDTLGAGTFIEGDATSAGIYGSRRRTADRMGPLNGGVPVNKREMMAERLAARLPMTMFTLDLRTGKTAVIMEHSPDWLNHLQFSPVDPHFLMYCHEGSGWRVDRIWTVRTDGSENTMIPDEPGRNRILETELAGHEWWSRDGRTIYVDLHFLKGVIGFLAAYNLDTKKHTWYHYEQNESQTHFNLSPDGKTFCGDGTARPGNQWIYLLHPVVIPDDQTLGTDLIAGGSLQCEPLCSMSKTAIHGAQNYRLEPNASFTPDGKYVVFSANILGPDYAFAVEVAKAQ